MVNNRKHRLIISIIFCLFSFNSCGYFIASEIAKKDEHPIPFKEFSAEEHNQFGMEFEKRNELDRAVIEYRRALKLKPDFYIAWTNLGNLYFKKGNYSKAIKAFKKALRINPDYVEALNNLSWVYLTKNERLDEALELVQKALISNPPDKILYIDTLATIFYLKGDYSRAKEAIREAISLSYDSKSEEIIKSYQHIKELLLKMGEKSEAEKIDFILKQINQKNSQGKGD